MSKKISKITCSILALACVGTTVAGCGKKENNANSLVVYTIDQGYGTAWLDALADKFEEKNGVKVKIYPNVQDGALETQITSGVSDADLVFESFPYWERTEKKYDFSPLEAGMNEDLTDIFTTKIPGEEVTIEQKLVPEAAEELKTGDKYYRFCWVASQSGIIYNNKVWNAEWKLPRTTNELLSLCETIKNAGQIAPFSYSLKNSYWGGIYQTWAAQYEGIENIKKYNQGYTPKGERYKPEMARYTGFLRCLEVMESLLADEKGYMHARSKEDNFTDAQVRFLDGGAAMQPNGDWIQSEMEANFSPDSVDIRMMKTPVISSIIEKFEDESLKNETALLQMIDYVDGVQGATLPTGVTETSKDYLKVKEARSLVATGYNNCATIPVYSTKKDWAKQFLQLMASDEGIETYSIATKGYRMPFQYDYNKDSLKSVRSNFMNSTLELAQNGTPTFLSDKDPIFRGGMQFMKTNMSNSVEVCLSAKEGVEKKTAKEIYDLNYSNIKAMWSTYMNSVQ